MRAKKHVFPYSALCFAHQMRWLMEDWATLTSRAVERRLRLVEGRPVPVLEFMPEFRRAQAIDIEREGGSV